MHGFFPCIDVFFLFRLSRMILPLHSHGTILGMLLFFTMESRLKGYSHSWQFFGTVSEEMM